MKGFFGGTNFVCHCTVLFSFSSIGFAVVHPVVVFVSAGNTERLTADIQFELEVSAACTDFNRALLHWCTAGTSQLLSSAEFVHLCEGSVCAVGVCSWQFVWVRFGEDPNNAPFCTHSMYST